MRILVVHQFYLAPGAPGGSRFNEMARHWTDQGHEVEVIAGTLNYVTGKAPQEYRGKWVTREQDGEVWVWRCHVPETYNRSYSGRMWAFFGFTLSSVTAARRAKRADVVIATSPPLLAVLPGWVATWTKKPRPRWIFEVRDLWPESAVTTGVLSRNGILTKFLYSLERWAYRAADKINVLTPAFKEDIVRRGLANPQKIFMIPNGADTDLFAPGPRDNEVRRQFGWGDKFVVLYSGAHGRANGLSQLIEAAGNLRDRPDIHIACVGSGPERDALIAACEQQGLKNIEFCGPQPKERMVDFVNACDLGAAVLQKNDTFKTVYPNKVFDYMACGKPTLLAIDGVARKLVCEQAQAGLFAEPENGLAIANAIKELADSPERGLEMGKRGLDWVRENASRRILAGKYLDEMIQLVKSDRK
jgi:glycosyltransferase involved in cell wall biosynthesis